MDLRDLRYFEAVARLQHVGRAAEQLHRTQPAVTAAIRRLERSCGAPLLQRDGRGVCLTQAGHVLLRWAERVRLDVQDAQQELAAIGGGTAGHVRIGIVPTAAEFLLPPVAAQLMREAPDITLQTAVALVDVLVSRLLRGELDLVVSTRPRPDPALRVRVLHRDRIVVAVRAGHELLAGPVRLRDLVDWR